MAGWGSIRLGQGAILVRQKSILASPGGILSGQEAMWPARTILWLATSRVFGAIWGGGQSSEEWGARNGPNISSGVT